MQGRFSLKNASSCLEHFDPEKRTPKGVPSRFEGWSVIPAEKGKMKIWKDLFVTVTGFPCQTMVYPSKFSLEAKRVFSRKFELCKADGEFYFEDSSGNLCACLKNDGKLADRIKAHQKLKILKFNKLLLRS